MNKSLSLIGATIAGAAVVLSLVGCAPGATDKPDGADDLASVTFVNALAAPALAHDVAFAVADAQGYFAEEGIEASMIRAEGSNAVLQALAAGDGEVGVAGADTGIAAVQKGVPVKIVAAETVSFPNFIAVPADSQINSASDLVGTKIGVNSLASNARFFVEGFLTEAGIDSSSEATIVAAGAVPALMAGLTSGELDAIAIHTAAYVQMEQQGLELRYLPNPEVFDDLLGVVFQASDRALMDSPENVEGFVRAMFKGIVFSAANPEAAVRIAYDAFPELAPADPTEVDPADVEAFGAWLLTVLPFVDSSGLLNWHDVASAVDPDVLAETRWGEIDAERFDAIQKFAITAEVIESESALDDFWYGGLIDGINDFSGSDVVSQALAAE
jgi:NitT/TauT family transport system substrate-binding protein